MGSEASGVGELESLRAAPTCRSCPDCHSNTLMQDEDNQESARTRERIV